MEKKGGGEAGGKEGVVAYVIKEAKKINRLEHLLGGGKSVGLSLGESWGVVLVFCFVLSVCECVCVFFLRRKKNKGKKIQQRKEEREEFQLWRNRGEEDR